MASTRLIVLTFMVVVAIGGIPTGKAQLGGLGGFLGLPSVLIQGSLHCSLDGSTGTNGLQIPVFPNASVALQCGNNVVSTTTTNAEGVFTFLLNPIQNLLNSLLNNCSVVVMTPLSTCNFKLPSVGRLQSPLKFIGNTVLGLLSILNLSPAGFIFNPALNLNN